MRACRLGAGDDTAFSDGDAGSGKYGFGPLLVHGKRRSKHPGMSIRDAHRLQYALDAAVLAVAAVQRVETDIGAKLGKTEMSAFQASRRGGEVGVRLSGSRVTLVGKAVTVFEGELRA